MSGSEENRGRREERMNGGFWVGGWKEGDSGTGRRIEKSHLSVPTFLLLFSIQGETIRKEERL